MKQLQSGLEVEVATRVIAEHVDFNHEQLAPGRSGWPRVGRPGRDDETWCRRGLCKVPMRKAVVGVVQEEPAKQGVSGDQAVHQEMQVHRRHPSLVAGSTEPSTGGDTRSERNPAASRRRSIGALSTLCGGVEATDHESAKGWQRRVKANLPGPGHHGVPRRRRPAARHHISAASVGWIASSVRRQGRGGLGNRHSRLCGQRAVNGLLPVRPAGRRPQALGVATATAHGPRDAGLRPRLTISTIAPG
jgi:hypothetical protein